MHKKWFYASLITGAIISFIATYIFAHEWHITNIYVISLMFLFQAFLFTCACMLGPALERLKL
jgi:hypothetical protein